jgi:hypothetical protein
MNILQRAAFAYACKLAIQEYRRIVEQEKLNKPKGGE